MRTRPLNKRERKALEALAQGPLYDADLPRNVGAGTMWYLLGDEYVRWDGCVAKWHITPAGEDALAGRLEPSQGAMIATREEAS